MGRWARRSRSTGCSQARRRGPGRPGQSAGFGDVRSSGSTVGACWSAGTPSEHGWERSSSRRATGPPAALVVRGEPGIGKSALLDAVVADVGDATVLTTQGLEAEAPLAFAALHRLLRPVLRLRDGLPAPQARALGVAFGEEDGPGVEPFLVAVATLSMLTAAAEERLVAVPGRRRALARPGLGGCAALLRSSARGRPGGHGVRCPRGHRGDVRPAGAARAGPERSRPGVGSGSARGAPGWRARGGGGRAARRGDPGQPAGPAGAAR